MEELNNKSAALANNTLNAEGAIVDPIAEMMANVSPPPIRTNAATSPASQAAAIGIYGDPLSRSAAVDPNIWNRKN